MSDEMDRKDLVSLISKVFGAFGAVRIVDNTETGFLDIFVSAPDFSGKVYSKLATVEDQLASTFPDLRFDVHVRALGVSMSDEVSRPAHYISGAGIESIDVIEAFGLGFALGNSVKYILRAGRKTQDPRQDLRKAIWYLERYVAKWGHNE